jgi:phosphohistidine phosphatase
MIKRLETMHQDIMIVGHLPHLSKFCSILIAGNEDLEILKFNTVGIVCLEKSDQDNWLILWAISPMLIL